MRAADQTMGPDTSPPSMSTQRNVPSDCAGPSSPIWLAASASYTFAVIHPALLSGRSALARRALSRIFW
jgi:hypothetical protein